MNILSKLDYSMMMVNTMQNAQTCKDLIWQIWKFAPLESQWRLKKFQLCISFSIVGKKQTYFTCDRRHTCFILFSFWRIVSLWYKTFNVLWSENLYGMERIISLGWDTVKDRPIRGTEYSVPADVIRGSWCDENEAPEAWIELTTTWPTCFTMASQSS